MPTLKHLLEELGLKKLEPGKVRISGEAYDKIMAETEPDDKEDQE
jgi:hypothetical protein